MIRLRCRLFAWVSVVIALASLAPLDVVAIQAAPDRWDRAVLAGVLDAYLAGRHDEAVKTAAATEDLAPFRLRFVQDVPSWINADPSRVQDRRAAAAAFLLELTHARLESDWHRLADLIEWICLDLRSTTPATAFERAWHHASVALAGRARERVWLLGQFAVLPHQKPVRMEQPENPSPRHLMHAIERFPDDSRLQLARIVAWTWGRDREPTRNTASRPVAPPSLTRRPPQMEAIVAMQPLTEDQTVGPEALVRIGQVHFTVGDYPAALRAFEAAQPRAADPATQYLARFLSGRALEALQRPVDAIEQYRRALDIRPGAESATVALGALRFVADDRVAAVELFRLNFATPSRGEDPGRLISYGTFMHWPALRAAMRAEMAR